MQGVRGAAVREQHLPVDVFGVAALHPEDVPDDRAPDQGAAPAVHSVDIVATAVDGQEFRVGAVRDGVAEDGSVVDAVSAQEPAVGGHGGQDAVRVQAAAVGVGGQGAHGGAGQGQGEVGVGGAGALVQAVEAGVRRCQVVEDQLALLAGPEAALDQHAHQE